MHIQNRSDGQAKFITCKFSIEKVLILKGHITVKLLQTHAWVIWHESKRLIFRHKENCDKNYEVGKRFKKTVHKSGATGGCFVNISDKGLAFDNDAGTFFCHTFFVPFYYRVIIFFRKLYNYHKTRTTSRVVQVWAYKDKTVHMTKTFKRSDIQPKRENCNHLLVPKI